MTQMQRVTPQFLRDYPLPQPEREGDKKERGRVLVIAGSVEVPGAAVLAGVGALRAGAGVLRIATCQSSAVQLGIAVPEARVFGCSETEGGGIDPVNIPKLVGLARTADVVLIGPGMMDESAVEDVVVALLQEVEGPQFVLDAAAFTELRTNRDLVGRHRGRITATPHSGEMARFLGSSREEVDANPLVAGRTAAHVVQGVVTVKGASTHIVSFEGEEWLSEHGTVGLATSGSGDTLAGILAGLLARGARPAVATAWSVYLHAEAGHRLAKCQGTFGFLAHELLAEVPRIMADLSQSPIS
jgi:ADP-dependent NAD(P)H-hydrate dehydratase